MSHSRSVVVTAGAAVTAVVVLGGCSLLGTSNRTATDLPAVEAGVGTVAASGVAPSTSPSTQISLVPTAAPTPPAVSGYALTPATATVVRKFETVASKFDGVFGGLTVRNVTKGSDVTGTIVLLRLQQQLIGNSSVESGLLPGMVKGMSGQGAKTSTRTVSGVDVAVAATKTTNIVAWYAEGTVVLVLGSGVDPAPTLAFAKAYLAAAG